jgi:hypothetical protein
MLIMKKGKRGAGFTPKAWKESGPVTAYVGMEVQRLFQEGWFSGIVTEVDWASKKFQISFPEDGDDEVMDQATMRNLRMKGEMRVKHFHDQVLIRRLARKYVEAKRKKSSPTTVYFTSKFGKGLLETHGNGVMTVCAVDDSSDCSASRASSV